MSGKVIDASNKFKQKRSQDFQKKVVDVVDQIPNAFRTQEENEEWFAKQIQDIWRVGDDAFGGKKRVRLLLAPLYDDGFDSVEYPGLFEILYFSSSTIGGVTTEEQVRFAANFVKKNIDIIQDALDTAKHMFVELEQEADKMTWPAPWRRYTRWGYEKRHLENYQEAVRELLSS